MVGAIINEIAHDAVIYYDGELFHQKTGVDSKRFSAQGLPESSKILEELPTTIGVVPPMQLEHVRLGGWVSW